MEALRHTQGQDPGTLLTSWTKFFDAHERRLFIAGCGVRHNNHYNLSASVPFCCGEKFAEIWTLVFVFLPVGLNPPVNNRPCPRLRRERRRAD
jgi:hypothetical protein